MPQHQYTITLLQVLNHLTRIRDLDMLELSLAAVLQEQLQPERLTYSRLLESPTGLRVHTMVQIDKGDLRHFPLEEQSRVQAPLLGDKNHWLMASLEHNTRLTRRGDGSFQLLLALHQDQQAIGVFELQLLRSPGHDLLQVVDRMLGLVRNHLSLLRYAEHDSLTGLMNRKTFDVRFHRMMLMGHHAPMSINPMAMQERAEPSEYWVGVVDIDHFKVINDRFGHLYGDEVLILLAGLMRQNFRYHDQIFRFGGEEFVILLGNISAEHAQQTFERLRWTVEHHPFPQVGKVTVSIGYTRIPLPSSASDVIGQADRALYYAKQHGRNQCCNYLQLLQDGELNQPDAPRGDIELF